MTLFLLLALEILFVSVSIVALWRMKARFGLAPLYVFVGSIQYLQTVLAAVFFIRIGDFAFSPGSAVLFSSSLFAILLVYLKEGVPQARTLIYGIVLTNVALTVLSSITELQINLLRGVEIEAPLARLFVLNVRLFVVGTVTVALDAFLIVISYEFLLFKVRGLRLFGRILASMLGVLYFDAVVFTTGTFFGSPDHGNILVSQIVSKTFSGVLFSTVLWIYLGIVNRKEAGVLEDRSGEFRDVFSIIIYQEKYDRLNTARARAEAERERAVIETRALLEETERARAALLSILEDEQQAKVALRESEERFRTIVEASPIGIFLIGADGGVTYGNPADRRMTGLSVDDILGARWIKAIHPEDRERTLAEWQSAMQRGEDYSGTGRYLHKDGAIVWWDLRTAAIRSGDRLLGHVGMVVDITARKQGEAKLHESELKLSSIYNTVGDAVFYMAVERGGQFRFISVNASFSRVTGVPEEMIIGKTVEEVIPEPSLSMVLVKFRHSIDAGTIVRWEETSSYPAGTLTGVVTIAPVYDAGGRCTHLVGSVHDITERKRVEQNLQSANDRLQTLSRRLLEIQETERRQIAYELHDEIGQALTATKINLQSLQRYPEPPTIAARLGESVGIVERALGQVRSLSLQLRPPLLDDLGLPAALRWLADENARRTDLLVEFLSSAGDVRFDAAVETACFRVAQEALNNVVKHAGAHHVTMELHAQDDGLHLHVSDDGAGFDVHAARLRAAQGASLGLLSMEERATLAGGSIEWRSKAGKGTEVHAWFPLLHRARAFDETQASP